MYRFSDCCLDPRTRELIRDGRTLTVSPKVFDGIAYLIEHRDRAVGRDELIAVVWGRSDVADIQLGYLMRKIRRTLGDSGEGQALIRTIPRFGFRWVADVVVDAEVEHSPRDDVLPVNGRESVDANATPRRAAADRRRRMSAWSIITAVVLASAALSVATVFFLHRIHDRVPSPQKSKTPSSSSRSGGLAVVPVAGVDRPGTQWMRLGLMDLVANRLREAGLVVVPSADVVAVTRGSADDSDLFSRVLRATGAGSIVLPSVTVDERGWSSFRLELKSADDQTRRVEASAPDTILAARLAADHLLEVLGKSSPDTHDAALPLPVAELLQRIEAALLTDDFGAAQRLIDAAPDNVRNLPAIELSRARVEIATDHLDAARERLRRLLLEVSVKDDPILRARILTRLGIAEARRPDLAISYFSTSIDLLESASEPADLGAAYNARGNAALRAGRYDAARADYARARIAFAAAGETLGLARLDNNEAIVIYKGGHPAEALPLFERAAQSFERFGASDKLLNALVNEMAAHLDLLQPAEALSVFRRAQAATAHVESAADLRTVSVQGATVLATNGKLSEASALLESVARAADPSTEGGSLAVASGLQARLALRAGRFDAAVASARSAVDALSGRHALASDRAQAWLTLARALRARNDERDAESEIRAFLQWARGEDERSVSIRALLADAETTWGRGARTAAARKYDDALQAAERNGIPADTAEVAVSYGNALLDAGDAAAAGPIVGRIGRWADVDYSCAVLQARLFRALGQRRAWETSMATVHALAGERPIPADLAAGLEAKPPNGVGDPASGGSGAR